MASNIKPNKDNNIKKQPQNQIIRVAILAEEPLGWGSGKHFFPIILQDYTWIKQKQIYSFQVKYLFDKDIIKGKLNNSEYDVLLVPGGGVGDGHAIMKGFPFSNKTRKWKKSISSFIKNGGGYVGICGGTALITDLTNGDKKFHTFLERQYSKSSLGVSCVSSYYKSIALPIFYLFQKKYPEKIGALAYVFSFAPGETKDGVRIHSGGAPIDFQLCKDHPIFSDVEESVIRIRWWGGPALEIPEQPDRVVKVLAKYPSQDLSDTKNLKIHAWKYTGGVRGLLLAFFNAARYIKKENDSLKNLFLYTFYLAGDWELTNKQIELNFSNKPSITAEIYPNKNEGRILLCTSHPEYLVWRNGQITATKETNSTCLGYGLYKWQKIDPLSQNAIEELTSTWWMVRRFVAWAAKIPDDHLPPLQKEKLREKDKSMLLKNIFWDGTLCNQMENI